jgi:cyclopropane-fatty-acyl-phospholipid synthase
VLTSLVRRLRALPDDDLPDGAAESNGGRSRPVLSRLGLRHTRTRDAAAVRFHYDVGNAFYALWLDQRMVYSCGYFPTGTEDLDAAQEAKLDYICRKLRLRPGERLLDIGCGWGGLVQLAAERYGVEALGVTLSEPQAALARERIAAAGLADRCRVEVRDYRELPRDAQFDKIVSVGMFEHVGRPRLLTYFKTAYRLLQPGGLFLNHGIATGPASRNGMMSAPLRLLWQPGAFVWTYVFPDGELVSPADAIQYAELAGFETRDVENLREHYTLTLRQWVRRLEARHEEAVQLVGEATYRVWRLYMAASAHTFAVGGNALIQALFSKSHADGSSELPLTRADLYA